jgi:hypothetical protein
VLATVCEHVSAASAAAAAAAATAAAAASSTAALDENEGDLPPKDSAEPQRAITEAGRPNTASLLSDATAPQQQQQQRSVRRRKRPATLLHEPEDDLDSEASRMGRPYAAEASVAASVRTRTTAPAKRRRDDNSAQSGEVVPQPCEAD